MNDGPRRVLLLSTYDLGHQPHGLATMAAWLADDGFEVTPVDLAVDQLDWALVERSNVVLIHLPMHTATRLAVPVIERVRDLSPDIFLVAFGLYAELNATMLERIGVNATVSGEYEAVVAEMVRTHDETNALPTENHVRSTARQLHLVPRRDGLAPLDRYVRLRVDDETERLVGYTETTRGCKHLCRHCPIVPVYEGRFRAIDRATVLSDVEQMIEAGAEHITFGDPDFFNGPVHGLRVVTEMHERFPEISWDCTIKIEHLAKFDELVPKLAANGCNLITSAVESFENEVLEALAKQHTEDDFKRALKAVRSSGIAFNPTFVAFTPFTTVETYRGFLDKIRDYDLIESVSPVQYSIRLLVTNESLLLQIPEVEAVVGPFDDEMLVYPWRHPDPKVDELQRALSEIVVSDGESGASRSETFRRVWREAAFASDPHYLDLTEPSGQTADRKPIPYLTEPWYC